MLKNLQLQKIWRLGLRFIKHEGFIFITLWLQFWSSKCCLGLNKQGQEGRNNVEQSAVGKLERYIFL